MLERILAAGRTALQRRQWSAPANAIVAEMKVREVIRFHGGARPWAVAGYRMGEWALRTLLLERASVDLDVVHFAPARVQYTCIIDGVAAAMGASLGKLNLRFAEAPAVEMCTEYRRKSTGVSLRLRVTPFFASRFDRVPRELRRNAGREVLQLREEDVFEVLC